MPEARYAIPFHELRLDQVELVGGKCANLGELTGAGFPVPPGFAVTTAAYERDDIDSAVAEAYAELGRQVGRADPPVAVRSSAIAEDMPDASFAGVQDTYLWVCGLEAVLDGVRRCWASFHNPEAIAYREAHKITRGGMSVAVQYMVDARVAGVMFTLNPVSGDRSSIAIDASYGLGVSVVGGEVTPDSFLVSKVTREIVRRQIGAKATEVVADPAAATTVTREVPEAIAGASEPHGRGDRAPGRDRPAHRDALRAPAGRRVGDRSPAGRAVHPPEQARDGLEPPAAHPAGRRRRARDDHRRDDRRHAEAEGMSDSPDLSPDDVREILRLVDESQFDEFELETPRFAIRFRRDEVAAPESAPPASATDDPGRPRRHHARRWWGRSTARPGRASRRSSRSAARSRKGRRSASSRS